MIFTGAIKSYPRTSGFILGVVLVTASLGAFQQGRIDTLLDRDARLHEQYRDCSMVGEYPTKADMP